MSTETKKETITEALQLTDEWRNENTDRLVALLAEKDMMSDVIIDHIKNVKSDSFAVDVNELTVTEYEKKLFWSGMMLAKIMSADNPVEKLLEIIKGLKRDNEEEN